MATLILSPVESVGPFLADRTGDREYLLKLANRLVAKLEALPMSSLEEGFCHGDHQGWNAHIKEDGTLTFFDFDCCGPGWRAYDIAAFL
jgi:Ser/Thr protein kinase RdoA (MazF antagonist)